MKEQKRKPIFRATEEEARAAAKRPAKRNIFRLDSSAYYRMKKSQAQQLQAFSEAISNPEPDDLISPDVASFLTTEIPLSDVVAGMKDRIAQARAEADPFELGGHVTQTMEFPIIDSGMIAAADTHFGVYVEIEDTPEPTAGLPQSETGSVYRKPGGYTAVEAESAAIAVAVETPTLAEQDLAVAAQSAAVASDSIATQTYAEDLQSIAAGALDEITAKQQELPAEAASASPRISTKIIYDPKHSINLPDLLRKLFPPRLIAFALAAALLFTPLSILAATFNIVYVHEDGSRVATLITRETDVETIFQEAGMQLNEADAYETETVGSTMNVAITRAYPVTVICDGEEIEHYILDKTAGEVLGELDIRLSEDDELSMPLDQMLKKDDVLTVYRVRYERREVTEVVEWQTVKKYSPLIGEGKEQVMNEGGGQDGEAFRVYRDKYVDGAFITTELESEKMTVYPRDVVTLVGDPDAVLSTVDGSEFCDIEIVNNAPTSFERVMTEAKCTAYSFSPGTFGASGMTLFQGFVAVNTNVIPYGTLLYITSPSGKFVYGWAIAGDTGTAMMDGYVDIDCYFETYRESALFGVKYMNVYIVKQLTQSELERFCAVPGMFRSRIPA